jgi:biotin transport system substrate-specific component
MSTPLTKTTSLPPSASSVPIAALPGTTLKTVLSTTRGRAAGIVLGSLFVAMCAQFAVPLPWTPVPMTMQPFGVLLVGLLLGPWVGAGAMMAYLLEGAAGLPVFVPGFGGLLPLGASAGYLLSYPLVAALVGLVAGRSRGYLRLLTAAALGDALILACGTLWLAWLAHAGLHTAFTLGALPFLAGDTIKVLLAASLAAGIFRFRAKRADQTS